MCMDSQRQKANIMCTCNIGNDITAKLSTTHTVN